MLLEIIAGVLIAQIKNYVKKKVVKSVLKNHLLHMKNQNIGVKKMVK